jgi:hypothetical protein
MEALMAFLFAITGIVGLTLFMLAYTTLTWGLVTYKFYYWFLVALYPAAPAIDFKQAVMISILISLFHNHSQGHSIKKEYREDNGMWAVFVMPWSALVFGYVIHVCM